MVDITGVNVGQQERVINAGVAQWPEPHTCNMDAVGSNPTSSLSSVRLRHGAYSPVVKLVKHFSRKEESADRNRPGDSHKEDVWKRRCFLSGIFFAPSRKK